MFRQGRECVHGNWRGVMRLVTVHCGARRSGLDAIRLVVDDDRDVTRELVKLYMLESPPEVVRDRMMFAVARVSGLLTRSATN